MSLPKDYNKALHRKANFYAAWFPVTTPHQIGDYGLIENGVFRKIGHLDDMREHGLSVQVRTTAGNPTKLDFMSEGASAVRTIAGASVSEFPAADVSARLTYEFSKQNSFVVKAAEMNVQQMENVLQVATALAPLRKAGIWSHRYRVVSSVYTGVDCLVLLASEAGTRVEFEASASALKQVDLGNVEFKPSVTFSSDTVLQNVGKTGPLGLELFKLKQFGSGLQLLDGQLLSAEEEQKKREEELEQDWGDDLDDDL